MDLKHEFEPDGKLIEEQVDIWIHNPNNIHEDIKIKAHKACFDKVKLAYPDFDKPTEVDWAKPVYYKIKNDVVAIKYDKL